MYSLKVTLALAAALCFCASGAFGQAASAIWALSDPGSGGTCHPAGRLATPLAADATKG